MYKIIFLAIALSSITLFAATSKTIEKKITLNKKILDKKKQTKENSI